MLRNICTELSHCTRSKHYYTYVDHKCMMNETHKDIKSLKDVLHHYFDAEAYWKTRTLGEYGVTVFLLDTVGSTQND